MMSNMSCKHLHNKNIKQSAQSGIVSLPIIFAFTILIIAVGVGLTAMSLSESFVSAGEVNAGKALIYSEAGARDALIRIVRDKTYTCSSADCYSVDIVSGGCAISDGCAKVSVSAGTGSSGDPKIITSKGQSKSNIRRMEVRVVYDTALDGEISTTATTWREISD